MSDTIQARSKPYPTTLAGTYQCRRCGIVRTNRKGRTHCADCKRYAK